SRRGFSPHLHPLTLGPPLSTNRRCRTYRRLSDNSCHAHRQRRSLPLRRLLSHGVCRKAQVPRPIASRKHVLVLPPRCPEQPLSDSAVGVPDSNPVTPEMYKGGLQEYQRTLESAPHGDRSSTIDQRLPP